MSLVMTRNHIEKYQIILKLITILNHFILYRKYRSYCSILLPILLWTYGLICRLAARSQVPSQVAGGSDDQIRVITGMSHGQLGCSERQRCNGAQAHWQASSDLAWRRPGRRPSTGPAGLGWPGVQPGRTRARAGTGGPGRRRGRDPGGAQRFRSCF